MSELENGLGEPESKPSIEVQSEKELVEQPLNDESAEQEVIETVENFTQYSKEELLGILNGFNNEDVNTVKQKVFAVKDAYDQLLNNERELALAQFIEQGGIKEDFKFSNDGADEKFFSSAREGDTKYIEAYLASNPSLVSIRDGRGNNALVIAAGRGRIDVLKILLKYRANPEDHTNSGLFEGKSALSWAASQGLKYLITWK